MTHIALCTALSSIYLFIYRRHTEAIKASRTRQAQDEARPTPSCSFLSRFTLSFPTARLPAPPTSDPYISNVHVQIPTKSPNSRPEILALVLGTFDFYGPL